MQTIVSHFSVFGGFLTDKPLYITSLAKTFKKVQTRTNKQQPFTFISTSARFLINYENVEGNELKCNVRNSTSNSLWILQPRIGIGMYSINIFGNHYLCKKRLSCQKNFFEKMRLLHEMEKIANLWNDLHLQIFEIQSS